MIGLPTIHEPPERFSLTCPLGLRFLDVATGAFVGSDVAIQSDKRESLGLYATACPIGALQQKTVAVVTPSGNLAFHGLPGLRKFENSEADDPWESPYPTRDFQIEVADRLGRFLPCSLVVSVPQRGLAVFAENGSPPWIEAGAVPLFSSPSRAIPGGLAVVRAELRELATGKPAAWAFVEANYFSGGLQRTARGMVDEKGRMVLLFAYPEGRRRSFNDSPPANTSGVFQQNWSLRFSFQYQSIPEREQRADYALRLNQPRASAWRGNSPLTALSEETLFFGRELNLGILDLAPE